MVAFGTRRYVAMAVAGAAGLALAACGGRGFEQDYPERQADPNEPYRYTSEGPAPTIFGEGGFNVLDIFGGGDDGGGGAGIGVNGFLWRAALDTVSFMPLTSADPFGGVIITDWYSPPETPRDRFKMTVYILSRQLRADGIRVSLFRQTGDAAGGWTDASVQPKTATDLENQILARARQLRIARASSG
ncbi:MAG: DUF3576 domain-containing protein [Defluviicoccus sp.]|nr:DUF3576 domain-containing protein [Defluviicoccus sp.]